MFGSRLRLGIIAWFVLAAVVVLLCAAAETWPFSALSAWELRSFGRSYPLSNVVIVALVPLLVGFVALQVTQEPPQKRELGAPDLVKPQPDPAIRVYVLFGASAIAALAAFSVIIAMTQMPKYSASAQALDLSRGDVPAGGAVMISGARPAGQQLRLTVSRFGIESVTRYLPLEYGAVGAKNAPIIVEMRDNGLTYDPGTVLNRFGGVLVANGLPRGVEQSFAARGTPIARPYWALYSDPVKLVRPYQIVAGLLLTIALALAGLGGWFFRKARKFA